MVRRLRRGDDAFDDVRRADIQKNLLLTLDLTCWLWNINSLDNKTGGSHVVIFNLDLYFTHLFLFFVTYNLQVDSVAQVGHGVHLKKAVDVKHLEKLWNLFVHIHISLCIVHFLFWESGHYFTVFLQGGIRVVVLLVFISYLAFIYPGVSGHHCLGRGWTWTQATNKQANKQTNKQTKH